jgi:hypothetical protein
MHTRAKTGVLLLLLLALISNAGSYAQKVLSREIPVSSSFFTTDPEGSIYLIRNDSLLKYSPSGKLIHTAGLALHGNTYRIDVSDPERVIVFFTDTRKVLILNPDFEELIRPFYTDELGLIEISAVTGASGTGLWFYNYQYNSLIRYSADYKPAGRAVLLNEITNSSRPPDYICSYGGFLYLNIPGYGILVLNMDGNYVTQIDIRGIYDFQVAGRYLYFYRDLQLHQYNMETLTIKIIDLPQGVNPVNARLAGGNMIVHTRDKIIIFTGE